MGVLDGKVALVTGAGQGIGRGIATALAGEGAAVALVGRSLDKVEAAVAEIRDRGGAAAGFRCDVTDPDQIDRTVAEVVGAFGGLSILVNNAQTPAHGRLLDLDEGVYGEATASGPMATWRMMRVCHPHLRGDGAIVNLASAAGVQWDPSGFGGYAAAKEAVRVFTRTAACEWGADGIRVNAILPLARTAMLDEWEQLSPAEFEAYLATIPLGRLGDPEDDIGPAVVFLCSPASRYVTGHSLTVDGGQALMR